MNRASLGLSLLLTVAVCGGGFITGVFGLLACDENLHAGSTRANVCGTLGTDSSLALLTLVPLAVMLVLALTASRRSACVTAALIVFVEAALFVTVLATAT